MARGGERVHRRTYFPFQRPNPDARGDPLAESGARCYLDGSFHYALLHIRPEKAVEWQFRKVAKNRPIDNFKIHRGFCSRIWYWTDCTAGTSFKLLGSETLSYWELRSHWMSLWSTIFSFFFCLSLALDPIYSPLDTSKLFGHGLADLCSTHRLFLSLYNYHYSHLRTKNNPWPMLLSKP